MCVRMDAQASRSILDPIREESKWEKKEARLTLSWCQLGVVDGQHCSLLPAVVVVGAWVGAVLGRAAPAPEVKLVWSSPPGLSTLGNCNPEQVPPAFHPAFPVGPIQVRACRAGGRTVLVQQNTYFVRSTLAGGSTFPVAVAQLISPFDDAAKEDKIQGSFPVLTSYNVRLHICVASGPHPTHSPPCTHHLEQGSSGRNLTSCSGPRGRGFAVDLVPLPASRRTACNRLCCTPYIDFLLFCLLDARGTMQTPVSPSQQATKNRRRPGPQPCTPGVLQARLSMPRSAASMVVHYWEAAATAEALAAARHRDTNETGTIKGRKGTNGCIQTSSRPFPHPNPRPDSNQR
ncbi:hypothetical protein ACCO45_013111 [Purpureocillium lilacinum]|uniref:Uncharacterized protein n=1 Tax=Purpureocillium lilacinum TaxID=33203 RepID=A0ACC4DCZ6_PURLI